MGHRRWCVYAAAQTRSDGDREDERSGRFIVIDSAFGGYRGMLMPVRPSAVPH
jgi:hypothetical protein